MGLRSSPVLQWVVNPHLTDHTVQSDTCFMLHLLLLYGPGYHTCSFIFLFGLKLYYVDFLPLSL
jgi:hypothetical protein